MAKKRKRTAKNRSGKHSIFNERYVLPVLFLLIIGYIAIKGRTEKTEKYDSSKYYVKGIDISHHKPILNWQNIENQNITFAYIKATEGTSHQDRNYIYNYNLAKKTNVKIGSYHFYTFALSGIEQANHFLKTAKLQSGDLLPAIDVEHSPTNPFSKDANYIALVINELKVIENEIYEHLGVHPIIYTNNDCYKLYIKNHFPENLIWISNLSDEPDENIRNWRIWQFSHKGQLEGIDEHIDLNYYRYSFDEFKELLLP